MPGEPEICSLCFLKLPRERNYQGRNNNTTDRLQGMFDFTGAYTFLRFNKKSTVQTIVHKTKYKGERQLAFQLGFWFASEILIHINDQFDVIVPVPLHPDKLKFRGYNQSKEIALGIASITGHPVESWLQRTKQLDSQTALSRWDRFENTSNEFTLTDRKAVQNTSILLLDDIITTGATITGTAIPLVNGGAKSIVVGAIGLTQNL